MVAPSASTASAPWVYFLSGVGTLTWIILSVLRVYCSRGGAALANSDGGRLRAGGEAGVELVEVGQPRRDAERLLDRPEHGFEGLVAVAGDTDDDRFVARDPALLDELLGDRDGGAAGRLGEDAL